METPQKTPAGWYPDPYMANTQRYWDGQRWSDQSAPATPAAPASPSGLGMQKGIAMVAIGILAATAAVFTVYRISQPSDIECATQRLEVRSGDRSPFDVHDSCR